VGDCSLAQREAVVRFKAVRIVEFVEFVKFVESVEFVGFVEFVGLEERRCICMVRELRDSRQRTANQNKQSPTTPGDADNPARGAACPHGPCHADYAHAGVEPHRFARRSTMTLLQRTLWESLRGSCKAFQAR
jgi:hypothetical protein